jgi:hypothetical protein
MSILGPILALVGVGGIGAALFFIPGAGAAVGKAAAGALAFLSKMPPWIFAVAAAVAFGLWCLHAKNAQHTKDAREISRWHMAADNSHAAFLAEKKSFAIEKTSLDQAREIIGKNNLRILAGAADLDRAKRDAAAADARNDKLAQSTDARIAALRSAATHHTAPCTLSNEAKRELENQ